MTNHTQSTAHPVRTLAEEYFKQFDAILHGLDLNALARVVECLDQARASGATIFIAGNGGSASTASHWANDLGKATKVSGHPPMRVLSLSDNGSWFSALANDEGYERVFSGQLENFASPGDVLIVISASGNSPNLISAVKLARERKLVTIGVLGFDGGALKALTDECLWFPSEHGAYGPVESAHSLIAHVVTACLTAPGLRVREDGTRR
jgi:D-sedoheptulose 7-phosphate isomerase